MSSLPTYPRMKPSGVEWLGDVPAHWGVIPLRHVSVLKLSSVDKKTVPGEEPVSVINYTDVYYGTKLVSSSGLLRGTASASQIRQLSVREGDVLLTKDSESYEDIGRVAVVAAELANTVCGYHLALLRPAQSVMGTWLYWQLESESVNFGLRRASTGVTRYGLSSGDIKDLPVLLPTLDEQQAIVRYLDHTDLRFRQAIRAKKKLIKLLKEAKQVVIAEAVTKGLDPTVPMKPSRVEWLGDVPAHWNTVPLKRKAQCLDRLRIPLNAEERHRNPGPGPYPYYGANAVVDWINGYLFNETLVLLGEDGAPFFDPLRPVAWVVAGKCWVNNHAHVLRPRGIEPRFLAEALNIVDYSQFIFGSTRDKLVQEQMKEIPIPHPPLEEQQAIARYLDEQTSELDRQIDEAGRLVDLLEEYRVRLIADVVTGKVDVREAAARLGDVADVSMPDEEELDTVDDMATDDLIDETADMVGM